jgi:hypothetical protein
MDAATEDRSERASDSGREGVVYASAWDHLADELRLLDARIYLATLLGRDETDSDPLGRFRSVVVTDDEVERLTGRLAGAWDDGGEQLEPDGEQAAVADLLDRLERQVWDRRIAARGGGLILPLPRLTEVFGLSRLEETCLVICMAAELDRRYERLYGYLQDDLTRNRPSVDLAMSLLRLPVSQRVRARGLFGQEGALVRHALIAVTAPPGDPAAPLIDRFLKIDDRIAAFLLGMDQTDPRIQPAIKLLPASDECAGLGEEVRELRAYAAHHFTGKRDAGPMVVCVQGSNVARKLASAATIAEGAGRCLLTVDADRLSECQAGPEEAVRLVRREAMLQGAALFFYGFECLPVVEGRRPLVRPILDGAAECGTLTFLSTVEPWRPAAIAGRVAFASLDVGVPDDTARKVTWDARLERLDGVAPPVDTVALASKFRFTEGQIDEALAQALSRARQRRPENPKVTETDLNAACRAQAMPKLGSLARKVEPRRVWTDLVLPADQLQHLLEICNQARYRQVVYGDWGFDRASTLGKGLNVLFCGSPGTGKTISAEVVANELELGLYKIDLSQVVNKYVGETEKNLSSLFREAQGSNAILFFDEADALFGKRSEVKDAHDRYANIEIGFLLQRMEEYDGISIMATNLRRNLDDAFVRRLQFIVEFPFPDEANRLALWRGHIPPGTPAADLDLAFLARQFRLPGGNIRNIAVNGAFLAASEGASLGMRHLIQATRREFQKIGRTCAPTEFGAYADLIRAPHENAAREVEIQ